MSRTIRPYKRKKGSLKQKSNLQSFNMFTDILVYNYFTPIKNDKKKERNKNS